MLAVYQIIEDPVRMTYEEMEERFDEKWIYLVNCEFSPYRRLISGVPVIVGDYAHEGVSDGIYEPFKDYRYAPRSDETFISKPITLGLFPPDIEGMRTTGFKR